MRPIAQIRPPKKILVVDNMPSGRMLLAEVLGKHGYRTSEVSCSDALAGLLPSQTYHAVILNVSMLPTSIACIRKVRAAMSPEAHLFVISATDHFDVEQVAVRAGAEHFLRVPLKLEDLLARLEAIDSTGAATT